MNQRLIQNIILTFLIYVLEYVFWFIVEQGLAEQYAYVVVFLNRFYKRLFHYWKSLSVDSITAREGVKCCLS